MSRANVAMIHYSCPPVIGGVEFIMQGHARILADHGHRVRIIVGKGEVFDRRVQVIKMPEMDSTGELNQRVNEQLRAGQVTPEFHELRDRALERIKESLKEMDVCLIHNILTMHFNMPLTAALFELIEEGFNERRYIVWCHDATLLNPDYTLPRKDNYPWNLLSRAAEGAQYVVISRLRQRQFAELFSVEEEKFRVIPDGIDHQSFLGLSDQAWDIFKRLDLIEDDLVMLFPSRILKRKNFELGIRIVKGLTEERVKGKLLITAPPDPHNLESMKYYRFLHHLVKEEGVEGRVIFMSDLEDGEGGQVRVGYKLLTDLYSMVDMLLITSVQEGFGIPLLEAGLKRLPIACSHIAPLPEVGADNVLYFELDEDPKRIVRRIIDFLSRQPTVAMFKRVMKNHSWEAIYRNHLAELLEAG